MRGIACDMLAFDWVGALATSDEAPDLIIAEVLITDTLQHYTGYKSDLGRWSVAYVDSLVGNVIQRLRNGGKSNLYNIAIMSDHGHSPIGSALHPAVIIPETVFQCEGSILHVAPKDDDELNRITEALAAYDVVPYEPTYIPTDHRHEVAAFLAPDGMSFEYDPAIPVTEATGRPVAISSHGLRPGASGDDRFAIFVGPNVPAGTATTAEAAQVAPTLASLMGLTIDEYPTHPIFAVSETVAQA